MMFKKTLPLLLLVALALCLFGCNAAEENYAFGTYYSIELEGKQATKNAKKISELLADMDAKLSTSTETSDVAKINAAGANAPVCVSDYTIALFKRSIELNAITENAFNPAMFPLVELWGFSPDTYIGKAEKVPSESEIAERLPYCKLSCFTLDENAKTITKSDARAKLDFGAIAKGYAADLAFEIAKENENVVVDIGKTFCVGDAISLYVASPRGGDYVAKATINNKSVATSGDYERCYFVDGVRYHHILDASGSPSGLNKPNPLIAVTIVGKEAMICDALSTAAMALGYDAAAPIIERLGYSALMLTENGYYLAGENVFEILDQRQKLV